MKGQTMSCACEFDVDPDDEDENTPETAWHFRLVCNACGAVWFGLHCPHDGYQNACPECGMRPETMIGDRQ